MIGSPLAICPTGLQLQPASTSWKTGPPSGKMLAMLGQAPGNRKKNMYLLCTVVFSNVCIFIGDGMRPCRYVFHEETHLSPSFQRPLRGKLGFFGYAAQGACLVQQCVGDKDGHFQWGTEYIEFWRKCNGLSRFLWVFSGLHDQWFCPDRCTSPLTNLNDGRS